MKKYAAPGILSEETLEQTSLACNGTEEGVGGLGALPVYGPGVEMTCLVDAHKGAAFHNPIGGAIFCTVNVPTYLDVVVMS